MSVWGMMFAMLTGGCGGGSAVEERSDDDQSVPVFTSSSAVTMSENSVNALVITTEDASAVILTIGGTDAALFKLENAVVSFILAPDYENPDDTNSDNIYELEITATDAVGNSASQNVTISVMDINETAADTMPPVFLSPASVSIAENTTAVTTITTDDASAVLALSGIDAGLFQLDGADLSLITAPDYENPDDVNGDNVYEPTVTATDSASNSSTQYLEVTITDVNETVVEAVSVIPRTGQITVNAQYDDGYYQAGAIREYVRDDDMQTVTETTEGLMWQDNETISSDWQSAIDYCSALGIGGYGNWRLPEIEELVYLSDKGAYDPAIDAAFVYTVHTTDKHFYWSNTINEANTSEAWVLTFYHGGDYQVDKASENYVRCVRDITSDVASLDRFARDDAAEVVTDADGYLMWQDDISIKTAMTWSEAIDHCEGLAFAGYSDWRLPNVNELFAIGDRSTLNPAIVSAFENYTSGGTYVGGFWSSTTQPSNDWAWIVEYYTGHDHDRLKTTRYSVRCVRDRQP